MPGRLAPPITFAFWFSRQCAKNATFATSRSEVEQDLAELARLLHAVECRGGLLCRKHPVDDRHDPAGREMRHNLAGESLDGRSLFLERPRAEHRADHARPL